MKDTLWAAALVAVLVAAAFFLPERLLAWGDRQLVDSLHMESQGEAREGFAESLRLTVPEKVMLLRGGRMTVMELDQIILEDQVLGTDTTGRITVYSLQESSTNLMELGTEEAAEDRYNEAASLWNERLMAVCEELRSLQALGGLPEIWGAEDPLACVDCADLLYLDQETRMSFQVYHITLLWQAYNVELLVDVQSGRILSVSLTVWAQGEPPAWGAQGASGFGGAWRDYWQMDSVSAGWYSEHARGILENAASYVSGGDYAEEQITFLYDGISLSVPLECQGVQSRYISHVFSWNR